MNAFLNSLMLLLKSRTFWTLVATALFNILTQSVTMLQLDPTTAVVVNTILLALASYFHINPSQSYNTKKPS